MIKYILYFWLLSVFVFLLTNPKKGIATFIPYFLLVPLFNPDIIYVIIPILYYIGIKCSNKRIDVVQNKKGRKKKQFITHSLFTPFVLYFLFFLCLIFFQNQTPIQFQLSTIFSDIVKTLVFPFIVWYEVSIRPSSLRLFRKVIVACIFIAVMYGLILTQLHGENPYLQALTHATDLDSAYTDIRNYAIGEGSGRIFGRIYSFFFHPMTFGFFLGISSIYLFSIRSYMSRQKILVLGGLMGLMIVFCGVRTVIAALCLSVCAFFVFKGKIKTILKAFVLGVVVLFICQYVPYLQTYVGSIFNSSDSSVSGSSLDQRLYQFAGCIYEIQDCLLLGKGYGWHSYYLGEYGDHPIILAFESLVYMVLCDGGIVSALFWIFFILFIAKRVFVKKNKATIPAISLLVFYFSYSCITGEFGYMKFFLLFLVMMELEIKYSIISKKKI